MLPARMSTEAAASQVFHWSFLSFLVNGNTRAPSRPPSSVNSAARTRSGGALLRVTGVAATLEVPATLRDSLTARLDRLGEAKMVAQLASVLGREFDYAILHAICDLPQADLEQKLGVLNHAEIIHQRGIPPRSHYVFKHALIQEAAYDTLLKSTRTQVHRRAAATILPAASLETVSRPPTPHGPSPTTAT